MKKVNNFNDFLVNLMLEENRIFHGVNEVPFLMTPQLKQVLVKINHPIAKKLLKIDEYRENKKVTFVGLSDQANNKFSLVNSNKAYDNVYKYYKDAGEELDKSGVIQKIHTLAAGDDPESLVPYWATNQVHVRIGSFIGKVFSKEFKQGGDPGQDVESFVQSVVAMRIANKEGLEKRFKLVEGQDIIKYYNYKMYDVKDTNNYDISCPLAGSCMKHDNCGSYIDFYAKNDIKMLILFSDVEGREDKIAGRAIVWELEEPSGRTFMDRIYYRYETDMALFKQYAEKQGWLYKINQNMDASCRIVDPVNNTKNYETLETKRMKSASYYPYMDTMKFFDTDTGILTNNEDIRYNYNVYTLEDTNGGYQEGDDHDGEIYLDYIEEYVNEDDVVYCEYGDEYRLAEDAVWLEHYEIYATEEYRDDNLEYSDYEEDWFEPNDLEYSEYHEDKVFKEYLVEISSGADEDTPDKIKESGDYRHRKNDPVIEYIIDNKKYYFDNEQDGKFFVPVRAGRYGHNNMYKHLVWDKDKLYKHNGVWKYEYDTAIKDRDLGQTRLFSQ